MGKIARSGAHGRAGMTTFIVRVALDESGELRGIGAGEQRVHDGAEEPGLAPAVERVATGLKQRLRGAAEISRIIRDVVAAERERRDEAPKGDRWRLSGELRVRILLRSLSTRDGSAGANCAGGKHDLKTS